MFGVVLVVVYLGVGWAFRGRLQAGTLSTVALNLALPALALLPVKLGALALISSGHALGGLLLIVATKLIGTAIVARLFALLQPALMQLGWFARGHARWTVWKARWMNRVRASATWRAATRTLRQVRRRLRHIP